MFKPLCKRQQQRRIKNAVQEHLATIRNSNQFVPLGLPVAQHSNEVRENLSEEFVSYNADDMDQAGPSSATRTVPQTANSFPESSDEDDELCDSDTDFTETSDSEITDDESDTSAADDLTLRERLADWAVDCNITHHAINELLAVLKDDHPDLPCDARTLLSTPNDYNVKKIGTTGEYYHFGLKEGLIEQIELCSIVWKVMPTTLKLQFGIDGVPLFKSSKMHFWPILCALVPGQTDVGAKADPFLVGAYCGPEKPESLQDYLEDLIREIKELQTTGIFFNNQLFTLDSDMDFICDAPAKALIKCMKGHCGFSACNHCTVEGEYIDHRMTFVDLDAPLRTDQSYRNRVDGDHHLPANSPLLELNIDMVDNFPNDYMHLICLGGTRRLLHAWLKGKTKYRLQASKVEKLSSLLINLKKHTPCDFNRKPRGVSEIDRWKATEFRTFLLYTGPVVLKSLLEKEAYDHFMVLSVAVRILLSGTLIHTHAAYAERRLREFVKYASVFYGKQMVVSNIHGLIHLAASAAKRGSLDSFSAFKFENHLQYIKKRVRSPHLPLKQLIRRYREARKRKLEKKKAKSIKIIRKLRKPHSNGPNPQGIRGEQFEVIRVGNGIKLYTDHKNEKNSCILTKCGRVVLVKNIISNGDDISILATEFTGKISWFNYPFDSEDLEIYKVFAPHPNISVWKETDIKAKCFLMPLTEERVIAYLAVPLIHNF